MKLADFAKKHKGRPTTCWACGIPQAAQINAARAAGVNVSVVVKWLLEDEDGGRYSPDEATAAKVGYHFKRGHHLKKAA